MLCVRSLYFRRIAWELNRHCFIAARCQDFDRLSRLKELSAVAVVAGLMSRRWQMVTTFGISVFWCLGGDSRCLMTSLNVVMATGWLRNIVCSMSNSVSKLVAYMSLL